MKDLLTALRDFFLEQGLARTYWIAYSGGLDSHVLLSLCHTLRSQLPLTCRVIHIHHGLSQWADQWAAHCAKVCRDYELDYVEHAIQVAAKAGESVEAIARKKRYAVFADRLAAGDILLTAHQQDDQAETVLLQLCRGAGPKGLAAMPKIKPLGKGYHGRPLLAFPRATLQAYAELNQLQWIDDESNHDCGLTRNFIRHDVMPVLKKRWPTIAGVLSRSAAHCAESQVLLEDYMQSEYEITKGSREETLSVSKLLQQSLAKRKGIVRTWIRAQGFPLPDTKKMNIILRDVLLARWDSLPCVKWEKTELRRYRDDLYVMSPLPPLLHPPVSAWDFAQPLSLPPMGVLRAERSQGRGLSMDTQPVTIRFRRGGEVMEMAGRGRRALKNLLQEWDVLPWERDRLPLVFSGEKLIGVVGYAFDARYQVAADKEGVCFIWED